MYDGTVEIQPSALFRVLFLGQLGRDGHSWTV